MSDIDMEVQLILQAASQHDVATLRPLLWTGSASVQDLNTGSTPLHAAVAACEPITMPALGVAKEILPADRVTSCDGFDGHSVTEPVSKHTNDIEAASKTLRLLLENGAIWNDLDKNNETPACMARRMGLTELYDIVVDAGVRAEMLLNRLGEYTLLDDTNDDDGDYERNDDELCKAELNLESTSNLVETVGNDQNPSVVGTTRITDIAAHAPDVNSETYLKSHLTFAHNCLLDGDQNGVMMAWESQIMARTADLLVPVTGLRLLNIGHGMGIIDDFFRAKSPAIHHIIEAHPDVIAQMKRNGWYEKAGVTIHQGKWQDVVPRLIEQGILFDAVYFDTFAEDYKALKHLFEDLILGVLKDSGHWGFFHGLGADRQVCYDVYTKVLEMDLFEAGYDVAWEIVKVPDLEQSQQWQGVKRRYWVLSEYRLPICSFFG